MKYEIMINKIKRGHEVRINIMDVSDENSMGKNIYERYIDCFPAYEVDYSADGRVFFSYMEAAIEVAAIIMRITHDYYVAYTGAE